MMKKLNISSGLFLILYILLFTTILFGCNSNKNQHQTSGNGNYTDIEEIRYAKGFEIEYYEEFTKVIVFNPWATSPTPYEVYYLYKSDSLPENNRGEGIHLTIPITTLAVNTFSYFEFISLLDESDVIIGVSDGFRVYNQTIINKLQSGEIINLGDPFNPSVEKTMVIRPQAIISSAFAQLDSYSDRLVQSGFPVIYTIEWMENSPLARAEWIKMIAAFFDKRELGETIFSEIEERYLTVTEKVDLYNIGEEQPKVMSGDNFQGTWYVPGGESYNAKLYRDAGLSYHYSDNTQSGSIGLDIESVLTHFGNADIWFGCEADSYIELSAKDSKYMLLQPVKEQRVYNNHNRTTKMGGNDFFESAIANPDLILSDLVKAAYPDILPGYSFTYIKPLD